LRNIRPFKRMTKSWVRTTTKTIGDVRKSIQS